jgi:hypothetical protein
VSWGCPALTRFLRSGLISVASTVSSGWRWLGWKPRWALKGLVFAFCHLDVDEGMRYSPHTPPGQTRKKNASGARAVTPDLYSNRISLGGRTSMRRKIYLERCYLDNKGGGWKICLYSRRKKNGRRACIRQSPCPRQGIAPSVPRPSIFFHFMFDESFALRWNIYALFTLLTRVS